MQMTGNHFENLANGLVMRLATAADSSGSGLEVEAGDNEFVDCRRGINLLPVGPYLTPVWI